MAVSDTIEKRCKLKKHLNFYRKVNEYLLKLYELAFLLENRIQLNVSAVNGEEL